MYLSSISTTQNQLLRALKEYPIPGTLPIFYGVQSRKEKASRPRLWCKGPCFLNHMTSSHYCTGGVRSGKRCCVNFVTALAREQGPTPCSGELYILQTKNSAVLLNYGRDGELVPGTSSAPLVRTADHKLSDPQIHNKAQGPSSRPS